MFPEVPTKMSPVPSTSSRKGFWVSLVVVAALGVAAPVGMYAFCRRYVADLVSEHEAVGLSVFFGVFLWGAFGLGLYKQVQVVFRGKDPDTVLPRVQYLSLPENPLFWFWILSPLLLPMIVSIYYLFLMLLVLMVGFVLTRFVPGVADAVAQPLAIVTTVIAWGFGLFSMGLIWHEMRKQRREQLRRRADEAGKEP